MSRRHSVTARVLAEVGKAQRDRIEDQIAEHAAAARPLADPRARVIVDPRRENTARPSLASLSTQSAAYRASVSPSRTPAVDEYNLQAPPVEHELAGVGTPRR